MRGTGAMIIVAVALVVTGCVSCATVPDRQAPLARAIERLVDQTVAKPTADRRFAGVVLVAQDGRPLLRKAYGFADQEKRTLHTPSSMLPPSGMKPRFQSSPNSTFDYRSTGSHREMSVTWLTLQCSLSALAYLATQCAYPGCCGCR